MATDSTMLMQLLRRVHRRLVALRLLEAAGLGVLGASLLCLVLTPLLVMRGVGLFSAASVLLPLGVLISVAWNWSRRPAVADAAGEVDRQLKLDDLLSTALLLRRRATASSFESAVLAVAEARCAAIAPRDLLLRRLGGRAWGGVGLAAALLLAVGAMTANPVETHAASTQPGARKSSAGVQPGPRATASNRYTPAARMARDFPGGEDGAQRGGEPAVGERGDDGRPASARDPSITQADPSGSGGGAGRSNDPSRATPNRTEGTGSQRQGGNEAAGGTGAAAAEGAERSGRSGMSAGHSGGVRAIPPWAAQGWPSAQAAAEAALRDGRVPPEYHDLVRAYFER